MHNKGWILFLYAATFLDALFTIKGFPRSPLWLVPIIMFFLLRKNSRKDNVVYVASQIISMRFLFGILFYLIQYLWGFSNISFYQFDFFMERILSLTPYYIDGILAFVGLGYTLMDRNFYYPIVWKLMARFR